MLTLSDRDMWGIITEIKGRSIMSPEWDQEDIDRMAFADDDDDQDAMDEANSGAMPEANSGAMPGGYCALAGTEYCNWECSNNPTDPTT